MAKLYSEVSGQTAPRRLEPMEPLSGPVNYRRLRNQSHPTNFMNEADTGAPKKTNLYDQIETVSKSGQGGESRNFLNDVDTGGVEQPRNFLDEVVTDETPSLADAARSKLTLVRHSLETYIGEVEDSLMRRIDEDYSIIPNTTEWSSNKDAYESRLPNPLREHNGYNYVVTLGVLNTEELANPEIYRSRGTFNTVIAKTSGGALDSRYQVFGEVYDENRRGTRGSHAEYYIEDLEVEAVIAPNPNTGVALGTSIQFNVTEPYSMGNFSQAVIGAAAVNGYSSYSRAPYCLKIEFVGWDESGNLPGYQLSPPVYIPILIVNMEFSVTGEGSQYEVTAVAHSEMSLSDDINKIHTPINASGSLVHEVLTTGDKALTQTLNQRIQEFENAEVILPSDRYVICFPKDLEDITNVVSNVVSFDPDVSPMAVGSNGSVYESLLNYASDQSRMNRIGKSELVNEHGEGSDQDVASHVESYLDETGTINRNTFATAPSEKKRNYQGHQNDTITGIIEMVVNSCEYAKENATERREDGLSEWYRIYTYTFVETNPLSEIQRGRPPMIFVYAVVPYYADSAKNLSPGDKPKNTKGLQELALKSYNYIYTGKNEDVIGFDINFKYAFIQTGLSNFAQNTGSVAPGLGNLKTGSSAETSGSTVPEPRPTVPSEVTAAYEENPEYAGITTNSRSSDIREAIATQFHNNIINRVADLVNAEMEIWGDPFFLPEQGGNWIGRDGGTFSGANRNGRMDYTQGEVFVNVKFQTPLDYPVYGDTVEFIQDVPQFSGLFSVWAVTNTFSGGEFKQVLKMIRRTGQTDPETDGPGTLITESAKNIADIKQIQQVIAGIDFGFLGDGINSNIKELLGDIVGTPDVEQQGQPGIVPDEIVRRPPAITVNGTTYDPNPDVFLSPPTTRGND